MSGSVLGEILAAKRRRIAAGEYAPRGAPAVASDGARFARALQGSGPRVIAEIKHRSPSFGTIMEDPASNVSRVARAYRRGGAAALSVVIERDFFGGDPAWLPEARRASGLPVLMKDFVLDEAQLDFAVSLGADAVLLIAAALDDRALARLHAAACERGLAVLVEAHDAEEARRAVAAGARIAGINSRDLATFRVDLDEMTRLGGALPAGVVRVAESGIRTAADVARLAAAGFGAFLVGESLLRAEDPARALRALRGEGATEVKVCGVTREEDLAACEASGVDWLGLNFSGRSPRRVALPKARRLRELSGFAKGVVAVFAGNAPREIREVAQIVGPDVLQLTDPPDDVPLPVPGLPVWQTVRVGRDDLALAAAWPGDALLFDTAARDVPGGTGRTFDWSLLDGVAPDRRRILAGGLRPENVAGAVRRVRPDGVDVASGVETAPGLKDAGKIADFVRAVRGVSPGNGTTR